MPETAYCSRISKVPRRISHTWRWEVSEDSSRIVLDFAAGTLLDLLSLALVDKQFHSLAVQRLLLESEWFGIPAGSASASCAAQVDLHRVLMPQVAQKFVELPKLTLCSPCISDGQAFVQSSFDAFAPFGEEEAVLHCQDCNNPILKVDDVISSSYRIMTGRAFLTAMAYNISTSDESYEAHYTTGQYTVRQVSCAGCSLQLGITYVGATDEENEYKVGKFLLGQGVLVRPRCCLLRTQPLTAGLELPTTLCTRCEQTAGRGIMELVKCMTRGMMDLHRTRVLCELLTSQHALEQLPENRGFPNRGRMLAPRPGAVVSWCFPLLRSQSSSAPTSEPHNALACGVRPPPTSENVLPSSVSRCWQDTLKERLGMLRCLRPAIQECEHLYSVLTAVVRFVGAFCRVAQSSAPPGVGVCGPKRVSSLLQLLPALVVPGRRDAVHGAGALALAVRKEWLTSPYTDYLGRSVDVNGQAPLTAAELEAIESAITAWAVERDQRSHRDTVAVGSSAASFAARERSPQGWRTAARPQPTPWRGEARRRLVPRSRSHPPPRVASTSSMADLPLFRPSARQSQQAAESTESSSLSRPLGSQTVCRLAPTDAQAPRATCSTSVDVDSDEEDSSLRCCSTCGAPSVKAIRGQALPQSSRDAMNATCGCRRFAHEALGNQEQQGSPHSHRQVVVIKRYLRCILPQAASSSTAIASARGPLSVQPSLQGDPSNTIVATAQSTPALPRRMPLRVLITSVHD